jgi:hypothetical protein
MKTLAQQIFETNPNIKTENELLDLGYQTMKSEQGAKTARYYFSYNEDFPSDFVSEYFWMQKETTVVL